MNLMTRRERTETVEEMDQEQIKNSEGMVKRTVQDTVFLYVDCGADKQEMMKNEMMNLMRKRGGQKIQEGTSENLEEVKRNSDKLKGAAQYTTTRCETAPLLKQAGQLEMCLCMVWGPISPSFWRCAHNVWYSCSPSFLCCECDVWCSCSPSF